MDCIHNYMWPVAFTIAIAFLLFQLGGRRHFYRKKKSDNSVRTQQNDAKVSGDGHTVIQSGDNSPIYVTMPDKESSASQRNNSTPIAKETRRKTKKKNGDEVDETIVTFFDNPGGKELADKHFSENYQGTTLISCKKCCVKFCLLAPTLEIADKIREDWKNGRLERVIVELLKNLTIPHLDCENLHIKVTNVTVSSRLTKATNSTSDVIQEQQLAHQHKSPIPKLLRLKDLPKTWVTLVQTAMRSWASLYNFVAFFSNVLTGHGVSDGNSKKSHTAEEIIVEVTFEVENNAMEKELRQISLKKPQRLGKAKHNSERGTPKDSVSIKKEVDVVKLRVSGGQALIAHCTQAEGCTVPPGMRDEVFIPMYKRPGYSPASGFKGSFIVEQIEKLGEQGQWTKFDAVVKRVMRSTADPDVRILVTFEMIVVSYYKCAFPDAAEHLQKAFDLISQTSCPTEHQAHALYTMSAIKRREGKCQESDNAIRHAMQVIRHVEPGRNTGEVFYNYACLLAQMISGSAKRDDRVFIEAKQNFILAIEHFHHGVQGKVYTVSCGNKLRKAFIRLAMLLLDCSVDARDVGRPIPAEDLRMARGCLAKVEYDLYEGITGRARCMLLMAKAVLAYRGQEFSTATDCARVAYSIAIASAFPPEVQFAKNLMARLNDTIQEQQLGIQSV